MAAYFNFNVNTTKLLNFCVLETFEYEFGNRKPQHELSSIIGFDADEILQYFIQVNIYNDINYAKSN